MPTDYPISDPARFDVREIPCRVKHAQILQRWRDLRPGAYFILVNDHDPIPLRHQFAAEFPDAFGWEYLERGPEVFQVKITKLHEAKVPHVKPPNSTAAPTFTGGEGDELEVDARGLEPPEPLVRIMNALEHVPAGKRLKAHTDRWPCHLFEVAEERGFRHDSREQPDGSWITRLERA